MRALVSLGPPQQVALNIISRNTRSYFSYLFADCCVVDEIAGRGRTEVAFARLPPKERTVSFTIRRPKRRASFAVGVQMSMRRPLTDPPVSPTTYSPLKAPASNRTRVPNGSIEGSAAINPRLGDL